MLVQYNLVILEKTQEIITTMTVMMVCGVEHKQEGIE